MCVLENTQAERKRVSEAKWISIYRIEGTGYRYTDEASVNAAKNGLLSFIDEQIEGVLAELRELGVEL